MDILKLKEERMVITKKAQEMIDKVGEEKRAFNEDEKREFEELTKQIDAYTDTINKAESVDITDEPRALELDIKEVDKNTTLENFRNYLKNGEVRGLVAGNDANGGYLAPEQFNTTVYENAFVPYSVQSLVDVIKVNGVGSIGVPTVASDASDAEWTAEVPGTDIAEDASLAFGKKTLSTNSLAKYFGMSKQLINKAAVDIEQFIGERLGRKHGKAIENAILNGTGTNQPLGIFDTTSGVASVTSSIVRTSSTTGVDVNALIEAKTAVEKYGVANLTWVFHTDFLTKIRKLKSTDKYELWTPEINGQATLLGIPYVLSDLAPNDFSADKPIAVIGDFKKYMLAISNDVEVTRLDQVAALKNQIGFLGYMEADGTPILSDAFRVIMTATA